MVNFKLNGKSIEFPTRWEDVSFNLYRKFLFADNFPKALAIITDIPVATIMAAEIKNVEGMAQALSFMNTPADFKPTKTLGDLKMPKNIVAESLAQFEDLKTILAEFGKLASGEVTMKEHYEMAGLYRRAAAIYYCKAKFGFYDPDYLDGLEEELGEMPCTEVIGIGSFFLFRPLNTQKPIKKSYPNIFQHLKKMVRG